MTKVYSLFDYSDVMVAFFDAMKNHAKFTTLETVINSKIDIRAIPLSDYVVNFNSSNEIESVQVVFGDMKFTFVLTPNIDYRTKAIIGDSVSLNTTYESNWCYRDNFAYDGIKFSCRWNDSLDIIAEFYHRNLRTIKHKASRTILAAKRYLANQAKYDMLEKELNIKQRKPKKK